MRKLITKFWGIGLIVVLLSSLFIAATPASGADPLRWETSLDQPFGAPYFQLAAGTNITDYAIAGDGITYYIADGTNGGLWQTTSGGFMWSNLAAKLAGKPINTVDWVTLAPDDSNVVVAASSGNGTHTAGVVISVNGGASFSSMNFDLIAAVAAALNTVVTGIEVTPVVAGGYRYIIVYGNLGADNDAFVYYYNYGAGVGTWTDAMTAATWTAPADVATIDSIEALKASPSFPSDYMAVAVSGEDRSATENGTMRLHILSFNSKKWDNPVDPNYPVDVLGGPVDNSGFVVNRANIALLPEYDGGDESSRISFIGASVAAGAAATEDGGIWRYYDYAGGQIFGATTGVGIYSVDFDGTNLAAGASLTNNVYRSADPLATTPTVLTSRAYKEIGVDDGANDNVIVSFFGDTLFGAKIGAASALSKSTDYGNTWNDFTFFDSALTTIDDIYYTPTGSPWYLAANDAVEASVYRMSAGTIQRVLCVPVATAAAFMVRGNGAYPEVIYAADKGATALFYTSNGGLERWYKRTAPGNVADLAVESQTTIYIGQAGQVFVYKSTNSGFTWTPPIDTKIAGATVYSLLSVGDNKLVAGSTGGSVTYTTDGGTTWSTTYGIPVGGLNVILAASGLESGDYIFATHTGTNEVYRVALPSPEFKAMNMPDPGVNAETSTGLVYINGILYAMSEGGAASYFYRSLSPTAGGTHVAAQWGTQQVAVSTAGAALAFDVVPAALRASSGSIKLYAADTTTKVVYYFEDTVAEVGPTLISPTDGAQVAINSITGIPANVNFSWSRLSLSTNYTLSVALDPSFLEGVIFEAVPSTFPTVSSIQLGNNFQPGTTYYWRVSSHDPLVSANSETRTFTVEQGAAAVPSIGAPANGGVVDSTTPAFSWTPVAQATMYQFQLSEGTAFLAPLIDETLSTTGIKPNMELVPGRSYFWRVRAIAPVEGAWSSVANFMVAEPEPEPTPPVVVETVPAPQITVETPPPPADIVIEPAPPPDEIAPAYIWAIIIIGAILVIAVIILIVRTRRSV